MCGIVGIGAPTQRGAIVPEQITGMMETLQHRGPDGAGIYIDDRVGLGHNRLSIIDLSGGDQPIHNEDQSLWIVYNGEIFNYPELRRTLEQAGHRFYTSTDTEVVLHLYEEYGPASLHQLNGQFALAIWNRRNGELFLARDRLGIRPLHYTLHKGRLLFASEIKALFAHRDIPAELDPIALDQIFTFWSPLPGRTPFRRISELPAGHYLQMAGDGKISIRPYWDLPFCAPEQCLNGSFEQAQETTRELLTDAIGLRLRADVPVGAYLSGGLDSSGIASLTQKHFNNDLQTYGLRFEEAPFDEGEYQKEMVAFLQTRHTEVVADNRRIGENLEQVIRHGEKPLLRTSPVPLFLLSERVRNDGVKVVLTGEGADEVFGGYNIFREAKVRRFWAKEPDSKLRPRLLSRLYPYIFNTPRMQKMIGPFFGTGLETPAEPLFSHLIRWSRTARLKTFFSDDLVREIGDYNGLEEVRNLLPESFDTWDYLARAQYLEMKLFLANYLLCSQGDRMAMAHSVEIRLPFLDYRLVEYAARLPSHWKISGLKEKHLLKKSLQTVLPPSVARRKKHPYRAPISESLLKGAPAQATYDLLSPKSLEQSGLFHPGKVSRLLRKLEAAAHPAEFDGMALAGIVTTQMLFRQFVQTPPSPLEPIRLSKFFDKRS